MSKETIHSRWQAAVSAAARQALSVRWRTTTNALRAAQLEYRSLYSADEVDIRALRKAAQRIEELERLRDALERDPGASHA
jgi:hypothetical protein